MYTVVIADDEVELRKAIIKKIDWNAIGFEIVGEAENGIEALELVEKLEPDLLLTDVKMPFVSGIELARQAREIRPAMNIAFLSGYDDFKYAQQAIQYNIISYLLKPISAEELTKELIIIHGKIDEKFKQLRDINEPSDFHGKQQLPGMVPFLMSLMLDNIEVKTNIEEQDTEKYLNKQAVSFGLHNSKNNNSHYMVLVTRFFNENQDNCTKQEHVNFINTILSKYVNFGSFFSKGKIVSLVADNERNLGKYVLIFTKEIIQNTQRVLNCKCFIGVSCEIKQLLQCNSAYYEAVSACVYSQGEVNQAYFISDIEKVDAYEHKYINNTTAELERLLKIGEKKELEDFLNNVFDELGNRKSAKLNINLLMIQMMSTVYNSVCSVVDEEATISILKSFPFSEKQFVNYSYDKTREEIMNFCILAREVIANQRKLNSEIICDQALQIINFEYNDEKLTLVALSERLHISSTYLSALIKKVKGETFSNLLTEKRMIEAKKYLMYSSMKIMEITNKCGYSEQHYFSYCFKKYYGMSPNKMRETVRKV
ncbi:MAG: response regulator transcription factor [Ruminiclostridium sp.]